MVTETLDTVSLPARVDTRRWTEEEWEYYRRLGRAIHTLRKSRGLTLKDVSQESGIIFQQIHRYEIGERGVTVSQILDLLHALEAPPGLLIQDWDRTEDATNPITQLRGRSLDGFIGGRSRFLRTKLGLKTTSLKPHGLTDRVVQHLEFGKSKIKMHRLSKLAIALETTPDYFLREKNSVA